MKCEAGDQGIVRLALSGAMKVKDNAMCEAEEGS